MTERNSGRNGDNFVWALTVGLFTLGALSLFLSFGGSEADSADTTASNDPAPDQDRGDLVVDTDGDGVADAPVADASQLNRPGDRFTISASGDILIHERVAEAATCLLYTSDAADE